MTTATARPFDSAQYWEARYRANGTSGAGSAGHLALFKAEFVNAFVARNNVTDVLDLGCGDGHLLSLLRIPNYTGVDVSATSLRRCASHYPRHRFMAPHDLDDAFSADLTLSLDVVFHLVEDTVFVHYMRTLFAHARRFVLIYASNTDHHWPAPHVRHRRFTEHVAASEPDWRLLAHIPNPYPYDPAQPDDTSFADFFVYACAGAGCAVRVPATT